VQRVLVIHFGQADGSNGSKPDLWYKRGMQVESYSPYHILIYGGGGHAKSVIDLIRAISGYPIAGIIDDALPVDSTILSVPVLGDSSKLEDLASRGLKLAVNAVGGIGQPDVRVKVFERLNQAGYSFPSFVHPRAFVEPSAKIANGVQILPLAYVGSDSQVGFGSIINYGAIVSHDCQLAEYVNLSPGATLAGGVIVGNRTQIGMRATVNLDLEVGSCVRIGNGATVKADVPDGQIVRAGAVWPVRHSTE
jgi:sugar O-acyltransferase (sialic acid O-acetyltransferase NeuD family)